ncbi:YifB family Mg chelatase-like AAA ATPase [Hydromonas duriensis]|uniref:Magnesium chelatase family protein n=1 Tax=Hydromonas duriensis TaxID=1527608 RepID=A0A4R6Y6F7_9BURK|nr:YifB family Mg chelatase-like AAA ATPase [Hydromonas duriensis]TDR30991.1 magnesium chelatase family protein [Hydromonas duriensis]
MSLAVLKSRALLGMAAPLVTVEVHLANGLPSFNIVGLPEAEVRESKDRVRAAILNAQLEFPAKRITVNLAPADLPKASGRFDLPIALGILIASGQLQVKHLERYEFAGELSLSGELRPVQGALAMTYGLTQEAMTAGREPPIVVLPEASCAEAALVSAARVWSARSLLNVCAKLRSPDAQEEVVAQAQTALSEVYVDWADVRGQAAVKRALEVAAAGGHSVLMVGPPGTGKSMLASRLPTILPPMTEQQAMESATIASSAAQFDFKQWKKRPFRNPHHTASAVALVGGGSIPRPGEISLAHNGLLFLDELPEYDKKVLEVLREPLESGEIHISRAARQATFPARFQLVAAMNPCPCGYLGHPTRACRCSPDQVSRYQSRLSGPFLNRIDMQIEVPAVEIESLANASEAESSTIVARRVRSAYERQLARQGCVNARLSVAEVDKYCVMEDSARVLLSRAMTQLNWSARIYHRVLRVARTIADMDGVEILSAAHIAQAIQYRRALQSLA